MLRYRFIFLSAVLLFSCAPDEQKSKTILCTTSIVRDVIQNMLPEDYTVNALMGPGVDPHSYKTTARDNDLLISANAFGFSGLNLETKLQPIVSELGKHKQIFALSEGLDEDRLIAQGGSHYKYDPHFWMDVDLMCKAIDKAKMVLMETFPEDSIKIKQKSELYHKELVKTDRYIDSLMRLIPTNNRVLITSHGAFSYFGKRYNVEVKSIQGVSTSSEASLKKKKELVDFIIERKIPSIFAENAVNDKSIKALKEAVGFKDYNILLGDPLFSDSLGDENSEQGTYIGMMRYNAKVIFKGLNNN